MSRKPVELPHIEDAAFAACLAPLAEAFISSGEAETRAHARDPGTRLDPGHAPHGPGDFGYQGPTLRLRTAGAVGGACTPPGAAGLSTISPALAEWRSLADQEFAEFCAIELFLAKTDAELSAAVLEYPKQMLGFLARLARIESRRALQHQAMTELMARIQMAMIQAEADLAPDLPHPAAARGSLL
jgi:hypothetical protein